MKKLIALGWLIVASGCVSVHSPYDLYEWCVHAGSPRLTSIGSTAHNRAACAVEFEEDLTDRTPRILYVPRDVAMAPVIAARTMWGLFGLTEPPF